MSRPVQRGMLGSGCSAALTKGLSPSPPLASARPHAGSVVAFFRLPCYFSTLFCNVNGILRRGRSSGQAPSQNSPAFFAPYYHSRFHLSGLKILQDPIQNERQIPRSGPHRFSSSGLRKSSTCAAVVAESASSTRLPLAFSPTAAAAFAATPTATHKPWAAAPTA